ncbi:MAG: hypothetical protein Q7S58_05090 [Candidatus Binatus sp.]|uniref:hypothetical protein n=1 Tax=Candidatus Binatus sp. TaxID=2811406 RepID=UPI002727FE63|nr:hypothetical protein [Candidatus Binatus sp.]MDO8431768.1 hypothetical protein [Candidatus Binatus sp.]
MRGRRKASESRGEFVRDRIAREINSRGEFTLLEIAGAAGASRDNVQACFSALIARGHVRMIRAHVPARGHHGVARYKALREIALPSAKPNARDLIWRAMRILRSFTISDLAATSDASIANVWKYLGALVAAGYARKRREADSNRGFAGQAVFTLARDTGPLAPKRAADGSIYDPNLKEELAKNEH